MKSISYQHDHILNQFPFSNDSAVLIDFGPYNCTADDVKPLVDELSDDYKIQIPESYSVGQKTVHYSQIHSLIAEDMHSQSENTLVIGKLTREIQKMLQTFYAVTKDETPFVSLRIVTEEYLKQEYPSVSNLYHRDSTCMTITKCFFGGGAIFTDENNIRRDFFTTNSIALSDGDALYDPALEYEVPESRAVLLKGEMWSGIDPRSQSLFDLVLGKNARFHDVHKGRGFIHKGGYFHKSNKRFVFTASTWKTDHLRETL